MKDSYIRVGMNEIKITDDDNFMIGTNALSTCVGVILYNEKHKKALVAHISDNPEFYFKQMIYMLDENNILDTKIKYAVIPGYYYNHYELYENLYNLFSSLNELFIPLNYNQSDIVKDDGLPSLGFIFNANMGEFKNIKKSTRHI